MEIVDPGHAFDGAQSSDQVVHVEMAGGALHQNVHRLVHEAPRGDDDQGGDGERGDEIGSHPPREPDRRSRRQRTQRAQQVTDDVEPRAVHVEAPLPVAVPQHRQRRTIDEQSAGRDAHHRSGEHLVRIAEALDRFPHQPHDDEPQEQTVDQGRQDLDARQGPGVPRGGGATGHPERPQREQERRRVGEHVAGVGEQREAARDERADDLDHQHDQRDAQHQGQPAAVVGERAVPMPVSVVGAHQRASSSRISWWFTCRCGETQPTTMSPSIPRWSSRTATDDMSRAKRCPNVALLATWKTQNELIVMCTSIASTSTRMLPSARPRASTSSSRLTTGLLNERRESILRMNSPWWMFSTATSRTKAWCRWWWSKVSSAIARSASSGARWATSSSCSASRISR